MIGTSTKCAPTVASDWLYYRNYSDKELLYRILYKSRINGKEQEKLTKQEATYLNLVGNQLYFEDPSDHMLYRLTPANDLHLGACPIKKTEPHC